MSFPVLRPKPILTLAQALAAAEGYELVPVKSQPSPIRTRLDRCLESLALELPMLSLDALITRVRELQADEQRWVQAVRQWEARFDARREGLNDVLGYVDVRSLTPSALKQECEVAKTLLARAQAVLGKRLADEALGDITGAESADEAMAKLREPAPGNPQAA